MTQTLCKLRTISTFGEKNRCGHVGAHITCALHSQWRGELGRNWYSCRTTHHRTNQHTKHAIEEAKTNKPRLASLRVNHNTSKQVMVARIEKEEAVPLASLGNKQAHAIARNNGQACLKLQWACWIKRKLVLAHKMRQCRLQLQCSHAVPNAHAWTCSKRGVRPCCGNL